MKSITTRAVTFFCFAILIYTVPGCKKDYKNPNAAQDNLVFTSARGMTAAAIGLQRTYSYTRAGTVYNMITANGFVTNELILVNAGNIPELQLNTGGNTVDGTNTILANIWANASKIIFDANRIISAAPSLPDQGYASGLIAYASIYKAMAIGSIGLYWDKVPDTVGINVTFSDKAVGFGRAVSSIDLALAAIQATPISASFAGNIPLGTDLVNTLYALKARYALFAGNYQLALSAANLVDLTKRSTMNFDAVTANPIFEIVTNTNNVYQPVDSSLGLPVALRPSITDNRIGFYTSIDTTRAPRVRARGFGAVAASPWPYYLPGEVTLIKAECYARQATPDLTNALIELNKVITKKPADDPFGIGADQSIFVAGTQEEVLTEIYRQRCIELFMSGMKLEDMRRFNRPVSERKRTFFPYPLRERDNNPNTPVNPAF